MLDGYTYYDETSTQSVGEGGAPTPARVTEGLGVQVWSIMYPLTLRCLFLARSSYPQDRYRVEMSAETHPLLMKDTRGIGTCCEPVGGEGGGGQGQR